MIGHHPIDSRAPPRLKLLAGLLGIAGTWIVEGKAQRASEIVSDKTGVKPAREWQRGVRPWGLNGDQLTAVGQGFELRDAVVLAPRRGQEDAAAPQKRAVSIVSERTRERHLRCRDPCRAERPSGRVSRYTCHQEPLSRPLSFAPSVQHQVEAFFVGIGAVGDRR